MTLRHPDLIPAEGLTDRGLLLYVIARLDLMEDHMSQLTASFGRFDASLAEFIAADSREDAEQLARVQELQALVAELQAGNDAGNARIGELTQEIVTAAEGLDARSTQLEEMVREGHGEDGGEPTPEEPTPV
jgi:methyl-accepting chemotaxis protein